MSTRLQRLICHTAFLPIVILCVIWTAYFVSPSMRNHSLTQFVYNRPQYNVSTETFVSEAIQNTINSYNADPIRQYCSHKSWNNSMVVNCDRIFGGIGNLRQRIFMCLRHAMHEGWDFIIPRLSLRSGDDLSLLESNGDTELGYTFNQSLFVSRLSATCPRMIIYENIESATRPGLEIYHYETKIGQMMICDDPAEFATNFGSLLTFPTSAYQLAFSAIHRLHTQYRISIHPPSPFPRADFLGLHLRTSEDAVKAGWSSYEAQSRHYLSLAKKLYFSIAYVASGNASSVSRFAEEAKGLVYPVTVVTKEDLIPAAEMEGLTWDQAALIDYVILESASYFAGLVESSFTWNVAMGRAAARGGKRAVCGNQMNTKDGIAWRDEWSEIMGNDPSEFMGKLWP
ncbi:hypothetical protein F5884DRAFT_876335 [Xylogone sp. PMI_703]|nr:hypothetical protein F5884DRAFT_876335 [Xylogone sp. PMI_703]